MDFVLGFIGVDQASTPPDDDDDVKTTEQQMAAMNAVFLIILSFAQMFGLVWFYGGSCSSVVSCSRRGLVFRYRVAVVDFNTCSRGGWDDVLIVHSKMKFDGWLRNLIEHNFQDRISFSSRFFLFVFLMTDLTVSVPYATL